MSEEKKNVKLDENKENETESKKDVKTQYCNPRNCEYDCLLKGANNCTAQVTGLL